MKCERIKLVAIVVITELYLSVSHQREKQASLWWYIVNKQWISGP